MVLTLDFHALLNAVSTDISGDEVEVASSHDGRGLPGRDETRTDTVSPSPGKDTRTVTAAGGGGVVKASSDLPGELVRRGPGVPVAPAQAPGLAGPTAEEVWQTGLASSAPRRPVRQMTSIALSVILIAASVVVIILRLNHSL